MEKNEMSFGKKLAMAASKESEGIDEEVDIHIGQKIAQVLKERHMTKQDLADELGMTHGNVVYMCGRSNIGVYTVQNIGNALKYNFWKHFPIDDGNKASTETDVKLKQLAEEKEKAAEELQKRIAELERELEMVSKENGYLKEINGLLKKRKE